MSDETPQPPEPQWRLGDITNGHILVESGWVPLTNKAQNGGPNWAAGDVVNGHAFTGRDWIPIPTTPQPVAGQAAAQTARPLAQSPVIPKEPGRWARQSTGTKTAIIVGGIFLVAILSVIGSALQPTAGADKQREFAAIVAEGQDSPAENDTQVVAAKKTRANAICALLPSNRKVENWTGTMKVIDTELGGDAGTVKIEIADEVEVVTSQGFLDSDDTMIETDSALFNQIAALEKGQSVTFSGTFVDDSTYCIKEDSSGSENGLRTPDFLMKFESIEPY